MNLVIIGPVVSEEKSFEIVDGRPNLRWHSNSHCLSTVTKKRPFTHSSETKIINVTKARLSFPGYVQYMIKCACHLNAQGNMEAINVSCLYFSKKILVLKFIMKCVPNITT